MAQEKPLDNREREAVGLNTPVEGLSVSGPGRFYPDDYSAQIAAYSRQTELMSRIPESLAKIIEYADDYKITAYHNKEQSEIYKKGLENELYKNTLEIDSANRVNAKKLLLQEKLVEAKRRADESNGDITLTEAYNEVFSSDEFRNPEEFTSLNSQKNWLSQYDSMQQFYTEKAMENDILNVRAEMGMNIEHAIALVGNRCLAEGLDPSDAMNEFTKTIFLYRKHVTAKDLRDYTHKAWDAFVKGCANNAIAAAENGDMTIEQAETTLRRLLDTTAYQKFVYLNKDGEAEKDADGQDATFTVALSPEVQASLLTSIKSLQNKKGTGKEDIDLAGYWKNLINDLGFPSDFDIDKPGELKDVFKGMLGKSNDDLYKETEKFLEYTLSSNANPSQKGAYARKGVKLLALVDSLSCAREAMTAKGANPNLVKNSFAAIGQQIDNGLRSGKDPLDWNPGVLNVRGLTFNSRLDLANKQFGLPERVDGELISRGYFQNVSDAFKTLAKMDTDSLIGYLDSKVYAANQTIGEVDEAGRVISSLSADEILLDSGTGIPRINPRAIEVEAKDMAQAQYNTEIRGGWGLSEDFIKYRIDNLNINTPLKAGFLAKSAQQAGTTGSLERFAIKHFEAGRNDKYYGVSKDILVGLLFTANPDVEKAMSEYYAQNPTEEMRKEQFKNFNQGTHKAITLGVNSLLNTRNIPGVFRIAVQSLAEDMSVYYGVNKKEGPAAIMTRVGHVLEDNFIDLSHMHNNQLIYKNSQAFHALGGNKKEVNKYLDTVYSAIKDKTGVKVDFLPDLNSGQFSVMVNGESFAQPVTLHTPYELGIKPGSERSQQFITKIASIEAIAQLAMNDKSIKEKLYPYNLQDAAINRLAIRVAPSKSLKVIGGTMSRHEAFVNTDADKYFTRMLVASRDPETLGRMAKRYVENGYDEYYHKWRVQPYKPDIHIKTNVSGALRGEDNLFSVEGKWVKTAHPNDLISVPRLSKFYPGAYKLPILSTVYGDGGVQSVEDAQTRAFTRALFMPTSNKSGFDADESAIMQMWVEESNKKAKEDKQKAEEKRRKEVEAQARKNWEAGFAQREAERQKAKEDKEKK